MIPAPADASCAAPKGACSSPRNTRIPGPPLLLLIALLAAVALHVLAPGPRLPAVLRLAAIFPLSLGAALNLAADAAFNRARTTVKPALPSTALVRSGVFRWTRNPMYLGFVLLVAGVGLALGSTTPAIPAALLLILLDRYYVQPEEEKLEGTFGSDFREYRLRVRRWI